MNEKETRAKSKFLSLVLRHRPETIGIALDAAGWVDVDELLVALKRSGREMSQQMLDEVVATNDKQRFAFSDDGRRIRANQGHSLDVELGYEPAVPPETLYHGTPRQAVEAICREGLRRMQRHHVHLHTDVDTALAVGQRRGQPVLLRVRSGDMHRAGCEFLVTPNGVWLTDQVAAEFIDFP